MILGFKIFQNIFRITWLLGVFIILISFESLAQDPFIPKYNAIKRSERCFTITEDQNNQFGAVWFRDRGNFGQDTTLYFVVYMGDKDGGGADGLAFVMHDDPRDTLFDGSITYNIGGQTFNQQAATGEPGGGLGYGNHHSQGHNLWIEPSVAVEFDTWDNNPDVLDGNAGDGLPVSPHNGQDHTSVVYNGDMANGYQMIEDQNGVLDRMQLLKPPSHPDWATDANIEDNGCYAYKINWIVNSDGTQTLELWADVYDPNVLNADDYTYHLAMRHTDDMINGVFGGETSLRFGFTGSTGGSRNEQTICLLGGNTEPDAFDDYATTSVNTPVMFDVEANDNDADGDNLFVPIIVTPPSNGTAMVTNSDGSLPYVDSEGDTINYIQYTPDANFVGTDTIEYRTCDVDSDKCYALCDNAYAIVNVGCDDVSIGGAMISPNTICVDTLAPNGSAEAYFVSGTARGNFWVETFSAMNNATSDTGTTPWTSSTSGGCASGNVIQVQNEKFRANKTGCEVTWETGVIDISSVQDINISIFLEAQGGMEPADYLEVYYILDGGAEVPLTNGIHTDNFGTATATALNINGSTLQIRIKALNTGGDENYYWDDLYLTAIGPASPPSLTYHWYEGSVSSGNFINTGEIMGSLKDSTYHVFAIDDITGCISDTITVTITHEPEVVDSVVINQISPFTKCELPYDGELSAGVIEGTDTVTTGYSFEWRYLSDPGTASPIRVGPVASNLEATEYRLTVISQSTGCLTNVTDSVTNEVRTPTVFPQVLSDVYSCTDPNSGIVFATDSLDGAYVSDVTHYWYEGIIADLSNPEDYVGDTITNLPPGDYAVISVDNVTGCSSESRSITIQDLRENPVPVVTDATDQISCDPSAPTGSFNSVVDDGGSNVTSGFTFNWYRGLNDVTPARPGYTDGPDVDQLPADQYRLIVTNDTSGCFAVLDTAIIENITYPELDTAVATNVTVCGPAPNGTITATPVGAISDFNYRLYSGFGVVPGNLITEQASNIFTGLDIGNYTVTMVDAVTNCESNSKAVSVQDATVDPTANFDIFPQIACAPADPTGRITASVTTGTVNDYTFEWFANDTSGTQLFSTRGVNNEILDTLAVGTYALLMTDNATQCQNVYFQNISPSITLPVIDTAYAVASTFCGTAANGELHATADGGQTDPSIFTFNWTDDGGNPVSDLADVINMEPGDYELIVTNDTTLCMTNPVPVRVRDSTVIPDPTLLVTDNSSCDPTIANGSIEVTDVPNEPTYDYLVDYSYTYTEFPSGDPITAISGTNGLKADSLFQGDYNLRITNTSTQCFNDVVSSITDINLKPVINSVNVITNAQNCGDPYLSEIEVNSVQFINGDPTPVTTFDYRWVYLDGAPDTLLETSNILHDNAPGGDAVPAGDYNVTAINSFGCESEPVTFEVEDESVLPTLDLTPYPNSSCNNLSNGIIDAEITSGQTAGEVTFRWENNTSLGNFLTDTVGLTDGQRAQFLDNGTYRVTIREKASQCENTYIENIIDAPATSPLIDSVYTQALTICNDPDGEAGFNVSPLQQLPYDPGTNRTYTFYLKSGSSLSDTLTADRLLKSHPASGTPDTVAFTNLDFGNWTSVVVDDYTHCVSPEFTIEIEQAPDLEITVLNKTKPSACTDPNGLLEIEASSSQNPVGNPTGFNFNWNYHQNNPFGPVVTPNPGTVTNSGTHSEERDNLVSGYYIIIATDLETACIGSDTIYLEPQPLPLIEEVGRTNPLDCDPGDGVIQIEVTKQPSSNLLPLYTLYIYEGDKLDPGNELDSHNFPMDAPSGTHSFNNLKPGTYTIAMQEDFGSNCFTNPFDTTITLQTPIPNIITASTPDFSCPGAPNPLGTIDETMLGAGFEYIWYVGTDTSTTTGSSIHGSADKSSWEPSPSVNNVSPGIYTLLVRDNASPGLGCIYKSPETVQKEVTTVKITDAPVTDKTVCSSDNGEIFINEVQENSGIPFLVVGSNYDSLKLYDENYAELDSTKAGFPDNGTSIDPFDGLAAGEYFVTARHSITNCISSPFKAEVEDVTVNPKVLVSLDSADFVCLDPSLLSPTGKLSAEVDLGGGVTTLAGYNFEWYAGSSTTGSLLPPPNYTPGTDPHIARELSAGFFNNQTDSLYTVVVTDNSGANDGCVSERSYRVPYITGPLTLSDAVTDQTICGPNGTIEISSIIERGNVSTADYTTNYTVQLLDDNLNPIDPVTYPYAVFNPVTGLFSDLPDSTYYTRAQNLVTGCPFGQVNQAIIKDVSNDPLVSITMDRPDYSCSPMATPTGVLLSNAVGGSDGDGTQSNFNFKWYDMSTGNDITDISNPSVIDTLREGDYRLVVRDDNSLDDNCQTERTFSVTHELQEIVIVQTDGVDQTWCTPNGEFWIEELLVNGVPVSPVTDPTEFAKYDFSMTVGDLDSTYYPTGGTGIQTSPFTGVAANSYFIIAQNSETDCESLPRQEIVNDLSEDPIVDLTKTSDNYSLNYSNTNSLTGILTAEAFENDGSVGVNGYNYEWYRNELGNNDSLFATASGVSTIQTHTNLRDAIYHVSVENDQTKCSTEGAINLPFVYLKPKFNPVALAQTYCMPPNGEINIPSIYKVPDSTEVFSKYFFDWHIGDYDESLPDSVKAGSPDGNRLRGLQAGAYYVHALDTFWMVESDPVKVTVEDSTTYPMMSFNSSLSDDQTSCNENDPNGALSILMQGFDTYTFAWYEGPSATGTPIANSETITGYPAGTYTFTATSNTTGCTTEKSYNIVDNIKIPVLATSTSPVTNCVPELANGIASANITNVVNSSYDFYWYEGMSESGTPVYTDLSGISGDNTYSAYTNISAGHYTVVAQDTFDCKSDPMTVQVINNLKFPLITYDELSPLTHCDPDKANAVFSALADGKATGYTFQWNIQNGPQYTTGPIVNNLGDTTYTLLVTNNVTGCTSIEDIRPSVAFRNVPNPLVDVLNHRTSCISPNGEAESYVNALMENFGFTYLGPDADLELVNPVNGTTVSELAVNSYYVFAKERTSGCISDTVLFTVDDSRYVPDYDVIVEPSNCIEPTGSGEVIIADQSRPYEVRWYREDIPLGAIREVFYQPPGEYFVAVEGTEGCIDSAQVEIPTDILIFNGVSDNSDGLNDIFHLECIYLFPNNNVKLFNRAGELVYEMDHYDNTDPDKRFRGLSNKGPVNGNELAIGTYYYVIDKGDGSKPLVGYLELNR